MTTGLLLLAALQMAAPAVEKTADGGVTADLNPVLWADVPDISICRKDGVYYMTSTTMHFNPGIPVMMSTNLVNWTIASYCYDTVENRDADRLKNGRNDYGHGTWASSIRYNAADGYFYVSSFNVRIDATYLFRTKDPARGGWEFMRIAKKFYDHSLWIEDGRFAFVAAGNNKATLWPMRWTDPARGFAGGARAGRRGAAAPGEHRRLRADRARARRGLPALQEGRLVLPLQHLLAEGPLPARRLPPRAVAGGPVGRPHGL